MGAQMNEPREWIIQKYMRVYPRPNSPPGNQMVFVIDGPEVVDKVRVVEKSAYDALKAELARIKGLLKDHEDDWKRIQDAERALEKAQAEIEVYRTALKTLAESEAFTFSEIARKALEKFPRQE